MQGVDRTAEPEEIAVTTLRLREMEGRAVAVVAPDNSQPWEEEVEEIMAGEEAAGVASLLEVDRPVLPEVPPEFLPVAVAVAGRETTPAPQRM